MACICKGFDMVIIMSKVKGVNVNDKGYID